LRPKVKVMEDRTLWKCILFVAGAAFYGYHFTHKKQSRLEHGPLPHVESLALYAAELDLVEATSAPASPATKARKMLELERTPDKAQFVSFSDDNKFQFLTPVSNSIVQAEPLVKRISDSARSEIIVIGIAGGSGSGKTTLAKAIYETIGEDNITFISHDSYYKDLSHLTEKERAKQNFDHPDSLDTALLVQHINLLKKGKSVAVPSYDYVTHSRVPGTTQAAPKQVVLVEGILIFSDKALYDLMDIKIFVDTDDDIRLIRRIQRDTIERGRTIESIVNQYMLTVRPMHIQFVEPSKRNADIIVPVGLNSVALDLVVNKLKSHLQD
jgi:uridine kinase